MTETKTSLWAALAAAQAEMGRAAKDTNNPHFGKTYADLSSVMDACMVALTKHGIAVIQPTCDEDGQRFVKTILAHGPSGDTAECRVPLIVSRNDMQGYGSAVTYARRYGLMCMAGVAADDDDGNAAAKAPPRPVDDAAQSKADQEHADKVARWCVQKIDVIRGLATLDELKAFWVALGQDAPEVARDPDVIRAKDERKAELSAAAKEDAE